METENPHFPRTLLVVVHAFLAGILLGTFVTMSILGLR